MRIYRLALAAFRTSMWTGEGGLHVDGRWHVIGARIVYAAQSLSLAQLEVLVHIPDRRQIPPLVCGEADVPEDVPAETVGPERLPHDWRGFAPYSPDTQRIGAAWLARQSSAVLRVPSAISAGEWNVLLNPAHPDFTRVELRSITVFTMDPRLK